MLLNVVVHYFSVMVAFGKLSVCYVVHVDCVLCLVLHCLVFVLVFDSVDRMVTEYFVLRYPFREFAKFRSWSM